MSTKIFGKKDWVLLERSSEGYLAEQLSGTQAAYHKGNLSTLNLPQVIAAKYWKIQRETREWFKW
jgi:hypothetical protein